MDITKGFTFTDAAGQAGNVASAANLHSLVDGATFANMVLSDFKSTDQPIYKSGSSPSNPGIGQTWFKVVANGNSSNPAGMLLAWNGSVWAPIATGAIYSNKAGTDCVYGDCVVSPGNTVNGTDDFAIIGSSGDTRVLGLCAESISSNSSGIIITHGFCIPSTFTGTPLLFGYLRRGSASKSVAASSAVYSQGSFGRLLDLTNHLSFLHGVV